MPVTSECSTDRQAGEGMILHDEKREGHALMVPEINASSSTRIDDFA
jgi:hypothetical protein